MLKNKLITPEGTRDLLFEDCTARRQVEAHIKELLLNRGFSEIITPGIEFYDVLLRRITESPRRRCTN